MGTLTEKEKVMEKIARWQLLAEQYQIDGEDVFIKTIYGNIHFCKIVLVGEKTITIDNYGPRHRAGTRSYIDWIQIVTLDKDRYNYNEEGGKNEF